MQDFDECDEIETNKDQEFVPELGESVYGDPYPGLEKKKEIVEYFMRGVKGKKRKSLEQMQRKYPKLSNLRTLYFWNDRIKKGYMHNFGTIFIQFLYLTHF